MIIEAERSYDIADEQAKFIESKIADEDQISWVAQRRHQNGGNKDKFKGKREYFSKNLHYKTCFYCGNTYPHESECPDKGKTCASCGGINHFAKMCRSKISANEKLDSIIEKKRSTLFSINSLGETPMANVTIRSINVLGKLDTGAIANVIDEHTYRSFNPKPKLSKRMTPLYGYNSVKPLALLGKFEASIEYKDRICVDEVVVMEGQGGNLSYKLCKNLGLITAWDETITEGESTCRNEIVIGAVEMVIANQITQPIFESENMSRLNFCPKRQISIYKWNYKRQLILRNENNLKKRRTQ